MGNSSYNIEYARHKLYACLLTAADLLLGTKIYKKAKQQQLPSGGT